MGWKPTFSQEQTSAEIDTRVASQSGKPAVSLLATGNLASRSGVQSIDGVNSSTGDRIALFLQTTTNDKGIYIADDAGAWVRSLDFAVGLAVGGADFIVQKGDTFANTPFAVDQDNPAAAVGSFDLTVSAFPTGGGGGGAPNIIDSDSATINAGATDDIIRANTTSQTVTVNLLDVADGSLVDGQTITIEDEHRNAQANPITIIPKIFISALDVGAITFVSGNTIRYQFPGSTDLSLAINGMALVITGADNAVNNGGFVITLVNDGSDFIEVTNPDRSDSSDNEGASPATANVENKLDDDQGSASLDNRYVIDSNNESVTLELNKTLKKWQIKISRGIGAATGFFWDPTTKSLALGSQSIPDGTQLHLTLGGNLKIRAQFARTFPVSLTGDGTGNFQIIADLTGNSADSLFLGAMQNGGEAMIFASRLGKDLVWGHNVSGTLTERMRLDFAGGVLKLPTSMPVKGGIVISKEATTGAIGYDVVNFFYDETAKRLGIGTNAPTARADLAAATTAGASLRIRTGVAPSSPNTGDIWSTGSALNFFDGSSTTNLLAAGGGPSINDSDNATVAHVATDDIIRVNTTSQTVTVNLLDTADGSLVDGQALTINDEHRNAEANPITIVPKIHISTLDIDIIVFQSGTTTRYTFASSPDLSLALVGHTLSVSGADNDVNNGHFVITAKNQSPDWIEVTNPDKTSSAGDAGAGANGTANVEDRLVDNQGAAALDNRYILDSDNESVTLELNKTLKKWHVKVSRAIGASQDLNWEPKTRTLQLGVQTLTSTSNHLLDIQNGTMRVRTFADAPSLGISLSGSGGSQYDIAGTFDGSSAALTLGNAGGNAVIGGGSNNKDIIFAPIKTGVFTERMRIDDNGFLWLPASVSTGHIMFGAAGGQITRDATNFFYNITSKRLGIGTVTPTAAIDLKAATTAQASLRFRTGVAPSSPNTGDMWSTGTTLNFYNGTSTIDILALGGGGIAILDSDSATVAHVVTDNIIRVNTTSQTVTVNLLDVTDGALINGQQLTVEDEHGNAFANNITIAPKQYVSGLAIDTISFQSGIITQFHFESAPDLSLAEAGQILAVTGAADDIVNGFFKIDSVDNTGKTIDVEIPAKTDGTGDSSDSDATAVVEDRIDDDTGSATLTNRYVLDTNREFVTLELNTVLKSWHVKISKSIGASEGISWDPEFQNLSIGTTTSTADNKLRIENGALKVRTFGTNFTPTITLSGAGTGVFEVVADLAGTNSNGTYIGTMSLSNEAVIATVRTGKDMIFANNVTGTITERMRLTNLGALNLPNTVSAGGVLFGTGANGAVGTSTAKLFFDNTADRLGIATATPTARIDLAAATTAGASLRIRTGTAPSSPNAGDLWYASNLFTLHGAGFEARGQIFSPTTTLVDGTSIPTDCNDGNVFTVVLGGNRTLANPTNLKDGARYSWRIVQDSGGNRTLAYGSAFKFPGASTPSLSAGVDDIDVISGYSDGTNIYIDTIALNIS